MPTKRTTTISLTVWNTKGENVGSVPLDTAIFSVPVSDTLLAQAVRVHLARERSGTRNTKTRADVTGSTRKIFKQKGTGNARHGSRKAPIFVGGGVAHGPKPQDFTLELSKTMRRKALLGALTHRVASGNVMVVRGLESVEPKTKQMAAVMNAVFTANEVAARRPATLLIVGADGATIVRSSRNLPYLEVTPARQLNAYDVMRYGQLIMAEEALAQISQVFGKKQQRMPSAPVEKEAVVKPAEKAAVKPAKKESVKIVKKQPVIAKSKATKQSL